VVRLQRSLGNAAVVRMVAGGTTPRIQRQPNAGDLDDKVKEATGVEIEPGPVRPGLLGEELPLPSSLSMRKPPGSGKGAMLLAPSFALKLDPRFLIGAVLDKVDLGGFTLINPSIAFNPKTDTLTGEATVQIPTAYPEGFDSPTEIKVRFRSSSLGRVDASGAYGPFAADLTLSLDYDSEPLRKVVTAAMAGNWRAAAAQAPGIPTSGSASLSGSAGIGLPGKKLPLTGFKGSADFSPEGADVRGGAAGLVGLPAGTFHPELAVPAAGAMGGLGSFERSGASSSLSGFAGVTGTPNLQAISKGDLGGAFEPFAYAQVTAARTTAGGHEFSVRISGQLRLGETPGQPGMFDAVRGGLDSERQSQRLGPGADPHSSKDLIDPAVKSQWAAMQGGDPDATWGANVSLYITFDAFGSK
jgi:hypothetical protein